MPLYIDNSTLSAVQTCHLKAGLRYVLGLTTAEPRLELDAGTACHASLAAWHRGEGMDQALAVLKEVYETIGKRVAVEDRLSYHNVKRVMSRFYASYQSKPLPYTIHHNLVEVVFEAPLDEHGDVMIMGRLDFVGAYQGRLVVGENKTTGSLGGFWRDKWPMHTQPTTYVYGAQHGLVGGKPLGLPIEECLILGIELRKVPDSTSKCRDHKVPYAECGEFHVKWEFSGPHPRPEGFIRRWRDDALKAARIFKGMQDTVHTIEDAVRMLPQQGPFNGACQWCEFQLSCRQGCPVNLMEANLVYSPWDPRTIPVGAVATKEVPTQTQPPSLIQVGSAPRPANAKVTNAHTN